MIMESRNEPDSAGKTPRFLLVHYHLFKNAGTSVDRALKALFGADWASFEADSGDGALSPEVLGSLIADSLGLKAVSSHTAQIKPAALEGFHPIDRIKSAYEFERQQDAQTLGAKLAKELSFRSYTEHFVRRSKGRNFRSFQTFRIAHASVRNDLPEIERALDALDVLPFMGVVENYEASMARLETLAQAFIPGIKFPVMKANAGSRRAPLSERLDAIREDLGAELYADACNANLADMLIWERARRLLASPSS